MKKFFFLQREWRKNVSECDVNRNTSNVQSESLSERREMKENLFPKRRRREGKETKKKRRSKREKDPKEHN